MQQPDMFATFMPIILIFVVFYFLLIRPQKKKMDQHKATLAAIRRGDKIVTGGGIIGQVVKVGEDDELSVEIAQDVRVKVVRSTVTAVLTKPQPAPSESSSQSGGGAATESKGLMGKLFPRK